MEYSPGEMPALENADESARKPASMKKVYIIAISAIAFVIAAAVTAVFLVFFSHVEVLDKKAKDTAFKAVKLYALDFNCDEFLCCFPNQITWGAAADQGLSPNVFASDMRELLKNTKIIYDMHFDKWEGTTSLYNFDMYSKKELKELNRLFKEKYGSSVGKVTKAYQIKIKYTLSYTDKNTKNEGTKTAVFVMQVGIIDGKWRCIGADLSEHNQLVTYMANDLKYKF